MGHGNCNDRVKMHFILVSPLEHMQAGGGGGGRWVSQQVTHSVFLFNLL